MATVKRDSIEDKIALYNKTVQKLLDHQENIKKLSAEVKQLRGTIEAWRERKRALKTDLDAINAKLDSCIRVAEGYKKEKKNAGALDPVAKKLITDKLNSAYEIYYNTSRELSRIQADFTDAMRTIQATQYNLIVVEGGFESAEHMVEHLTEIVKLQQHEIEALTGRTLPKTPEPIEFE